MSARAANHLRLQIKDRPRTPASAAWTRRDAWRRSYSSSALNETLKEGPGKPSTGPLAVVQLSQFDFCNNTLGEFFGIAEDATFEVSRKLDQAHLKATVPGFLDETGVEAPAVVDLTWAGAGELFSETVRSRVKFPGSMLTQWFKGTFRPAQVSGTVTVGKQNLATDPVDALIIRHAGQPGGRADSVGDLEITTGRRRRARTPARSFRDPERCWIASTRWGLGVACHVYDH